ncbi:hypothetical protein TEMA_36940 [Terrisporobacter mayombei]|uniref:Uncharacterized protein n=1 Tax=Terrisporobacter mayombei TaxID=1541 RepID=A0ABY9Q5B0_9FIRM|nr:hypothetical protein TEMA_36940 [Terrisporobacter mayombei]
MQYINRILEEIETNVIKTTALNLGYEAIFCGIKIARRKRV